MERFSHPFDLWLGEGNLVFSERKKSLGISYPGRGKVREISFGISAEEVKNIVLPRMASGHK